MEANEQVTQGTPQEEQAPATSPMNDMERNILETPHEQDPFAELIGGDSGGIHGTPVEEEQLNQPGITSEPEVAQQTPEPTPIETPPTNDEVRYNYWQSEAAKRQNENQALKEQLAKVQQHMPAIEALNQNPQIAQQILESQQALPGQAPEQGGFPQPPVKPEKPAYFSREEAYSDPRSESAQYLDSMEQWRDDMLTYNQMESQYQVAQVQETYDKKIQDLEKVEMQRRAYAQEQAKNQEIRQYVQSNYDLGDNLNNFIDEMSNPKSINMKDLVGYYKYKHGIADVPANQAVNQVVPPAGPAQPSPDFNQIKRAQSVPTPMGVQTATQNTSTSPDDGFMDSLIASDKSNNLF